MKEEQLGQLTFDFIAYHVQEIDEPPLTIESLVNDKPLFVSFDLEEWLPTHLDLKKYRLYTIFFTVDGYVTLKGKDKHFESTYFDLFRVKGIPKTDKFITTVTDACTSVYKKLGTQFFYLKGMNDVDEGLLYRAKDCVTAIIPYVAVENKEGITFQVDEESLNGIVPDIVKESKIEKTKTEEFLLRAKKLKEEERKNSSKVSVQFGEDEVVSFKLRNDVPDNVKILPREEMMTMMGDFIKSLREVEEEIKKDKEGNYRVRFF